MLTADNTSKCIDFILKSIHYSCEKTKEKLSKIKRKVIIGPLWDKYGVMITCRPPPSENPGHAPGVFA